MKINMKDSAKANTVARLILPIVLFLIAVGLLWSCIYWGVPIGKAWAKVQNEEPFQGVSRMWFATSIILNIVFAAASLWAIDNLAEYKHIHDHPRYRGFWIFPLFALLIYTGGGVYCLAHMESDRVFHWLKMTCLVSVFLCTIFDAAMYRIARRERGQCSKHDPSAELKTMLLAVDIPTIVVILLTMFLVDQYRDQLSGDSYVIGLSTGAVVVEMCFANVVYFMQTVFADASDGLVALYGKGE